MTEIIWQAITQSTNDDAKKMAGRKDDVWIAAEQQTRGRGRRGRFWHSPIGNLYASWLGRVACAPHRAAQLSFVAAIAAERAICDFLPAAALSFKWPNDVLCEGKKMRRHIIGAGGDGRSAVAGRRHWRQFARST